MASGVQATLLWLSLRRRLRARVGRELLRSFAKTTLASALAAVVTLYALRALELTRGAWAALLGAPSFALLFLLMARLVRSEELLSLDALIRRKLQR